MSRKVGEGLTTQAGAGGRSQVCMGPSAGEIGVEGWYHLLRTVNGEVVSSSFMST